MRCDSNAKRPTQQWFCFRVKNTKKDDTVRFNIVNFAKKESLFSQGMRVSLFSQKRNERFRTGWFRGATILKYMPSKISRTYSPTFRSPRMPQQSRSNSPLKQTVASPRPLNVDLLSAGALQSYEQQTPRKHEAELYRQIQPPESYSVSASPRRKDFARPVKRMQTSGQIRQNLGNLSTQEDPGIGATGVLYYSTKQQPVVDETLGLLAKIGAQDIRKRNYYQLSFEYTFEFQNDCVYFAYAIPYSFSMVNQQISKLLSDCQTYGCTSNKLKHERVIMRDPFSIPETVSPRCGSPQSRNRIVKLESICKTLSGVEVPMLTITDFKHPLHNNPASNNSPTSSCKTRGKKKGTKNRDESRQQEEEDPEHYLPVIFLAGRIHPSESHASWIIHGFLEALLSNLKLAQQLRKRFVFKVVPMCNVDGVIAGNNRTSLIGKDLNRRYENPNQKMHPVNYSIKKEVARLQEDKRVMAFFDVHSHSRRKCTFLYGPRFPLHSPYYLGIRAVPKLLAEESEAFRYYSCKFKNERKKQGSARISMWRDLGVNLSYTLETSFLGFLNKERTTLEFSIPQLLKLGRDLARTLLEYALIKERTMRSRPSLKKKDSPQIKSHKIASSSQLTKVHYKTPPSMAQSSPMSSTIKSETRSSAGRLTLNNLTSENQKEGQLSEWMTFLQSGGDPRMFLEDVESEVKERRKVVRVPSMPFGVDQLSDDLSDLDLLEDELREEEEEAKGQRRGKKHRTMQQVLEGVIHDKEKIMRYKARKDKREREEGEEGFDSEEFDEEELASSSDENQDNEKGSSESDSEDDFQEMLKQAIEESCAQHDPSEVGEKKIQPSQQRIELNNSVEGVLKARHFYPPTLPSQIYLNAQITQECESSKQPSMRSTGRWGVKSRPKVSQEYTDDHSHQPRQKGLKRPKPAKPQIHVRNLFEECFDDRHVIETKNRWPVAKGLKPKLFKQAGVNKAYNRHILSRSGVKESSSVSLTRPTTQSQRLAGDILPADISLPRTNNEYIAHSKAAQRIGNILQSTEMPPTLSSYFSDMLGQQSRMRKESGAYAIIRNEAAALNEYKAIPPMSQSRDPGMEIVYFQQESGGPTGRVYRAGLSYRPGTGRSVVANRSSTMSCSMRGEYSEHTRAHKQSGRVTDGTSFESPNKHFIRAQSKGEIGARQTGNTIRAQQKKVLPFSLAGIHSSPNTIYNSVLRGQGSSASIKLDESQNYSGMPTPPTVAPPILRPTQYGIGFIPSQSSTSFRGRLTPSMLNKIKPD